MKGFEEPIYIPSNQDNPFNCIYFAKGYFSSALHECSHWLIAGEERRKLEDYGYWYVPDGRNEKEQKLFQQVEIKPQALEWILSIAANFKFNISLDNLESNCEESLQFKKAVYDQVNTYCLKGLPLRAHLFRLALCNFYSTDLKLNIKDFDFVSI